LKKSFFIDFPKMAAAATTKSSDTKAKDVANAGRTFVICVEQKGTRSKHVYKKIMGKTLGDVIDAAVGPGPREHVRVEGPCNDTLPLCHRNNNLMWCTITPKVRAIELDKMFPITNQLQHGYVYAVVVGTLLKTTDGCTLQMPWNRQMDEVRCHNSEPGVCPHCGLDDS
jgi:hypothetical protein